MQILLISIFLVPALLYLAAWGLGLRKLPGSGDEPAAASRSPSDPAAQTLADTSSGLPASGASSILLLLALLVHLGSLYVAIAPGGTITLGFAHVMSAALWVGVCLVWMELNDARARAIRIMVLPVASVCAVLPLVFPGRALGDIAGRSLLVPHLLIGILAYSVLLLALLHAVLMAGAERRLRAAPGESTHVFDRILDRLPPLLSMERVLFRLIAFGFGLLTLTAVSGMFYSEHIFGQPFRFDHKTLFTLLAWAVFGVLLLGRRFRGWRGRTALHLTIAGFVIMMLGYVGSRFVLEAVLGRI